MNASPLAALLLISLASLRANEATCLIQLDASSQGRLFEGIGAVSAGASSRLLFDYAEPQRGQILDYLFKPQFGAGFQHLKVEIGCGENSTCGSEPSHVIRAEELADPQPRGYEFQLMAEARKRNPDLFLDCLPWAYPHWIKNRFSQESADWLVAFLNTARNRYGLELDWLSAAQNEMGTDLEWIRHTLRPTLNAHGFSNVKLQAPDDDEGYWKIFDTLEKDPELDQLINAVGYHYVDGRNPWKIDQNGKRNATEKAKKSGKPLWASEEWSQCGREWDGKGALYLARLINKLYTRDRITKYQIWCPIDSIYDQISWGTTGAMQADAPWCGHYEVWPALWAIAHTTQFAKPGWRYLDAACGQINSDTWTGSHVAFCDPKTNDWSVVIVTGEARKIRLQLAPNLNQGPVHIWRSNATEQFVELDPVTLNNGAVELTLEANAIYSLTNTTGQQKGSAGPIPPLQPYPLPFVETFDDTLPGQLPRYFADQKGSFEVVRRPNQGNCMAQIVPAEGSIWMGARLLKPHTLFGDANWQDVAVEADVLISGGDAEIGGRYSDRKQLGYRWALQHDGEWKLYWRLNLLASGKLQDFKPASWHQLRLEMTGNRIRGLIDGVQLAQVSHTEGKAGMAFVASSYNDNRFDNVRVEACPAAH